MSFLSVRGVSKSYGPHQAVCDLSFSVARGECLALLGPSGCGKTTLLNIVAGFIAPDAGSIEVDGRSMTGVPPHLRGMGMVFQDYALFPHLSVIDNVAFGLRMRRVGATERRESARAALALVGLSGYDDRGIGQLSGGQRQRVAVARALAIQPALLLFDEPLSNLDARLRETMRTEIRALLARTRITSLFVTHDQAEAFAVADRVALLDAGRLEQIGQLDEIYERPVNHFAASFLGSCNLIHGRCVASGEGTVVVDALDTRLSGLRPAGLPACVPGAPATLAIRPHHIVIETAGDASPGNRVDGVVEAVEYLGWLTKIAVRHASGTAIMLEVSGKSPVVVGSPVTLGWRAEHTWSIAEPGS